MDGHSVLENPGIRHEVQFGTCECQRLDNRQSQSLYDPRSGEVHAIW